MPAMVRAQQRVHEDDEGNHLKMCASVCLVAQRLRAHPLGRACTHTCTHDLSYARTHAGPNTRIRVHKAVGMCAPAHSPGEREDTRTRLSVSPSPAPQPPRRAGARHRSLCTCRLPVRVRVHVRASTASTCPSLDTGHLHRASPVPSEWCRQPVRECARERARACTPARACLSLHPSCLLLCICA